MPETLSRKISPNSFFQNNSEENVQSMQQSSDALNTAETALVKVNSNDKYLQSLIQSITTQNTETSQQNGEFSKSISFLNSSYSSLSSGLQSLRMDVESISKYLSDEQKQREKSLEQRETIIAATKDKQEKQGIIQSIRKSVVGGVQGAFQSGGAGGDKSGEGSFLKDLIKGAVGAAGIGLGTGIDNALNPPPDDSNYQPPSEKTYTLPQLRDLALSAGFKGENADKAAAIAYAESTGNTQALNDNYKKGGGDNSFGLWQINMIDKPGYKLGEERRRKFGLKSNKELWDPQVNAKVALSISGGSNFSAWTTYGGNTYNYALKQIEKLPSKSTAKPKPQKSTAKPQSIAASTQNLAEPPTPQSPASNTSSADIALNSAAQTIKKSNVAPLKPASNVSNITPPPATSTVVTLPAIKQDSKGVNSVVNSTPDAPPVFETNNPLTRLWTIASINHLNLNAAIPHIYG